MTDSTHVTRGTLERNAHLLEDIFTDLFGHSPQFHKLLPDQELDRRPILVRPPPPPIMLMRSR